MIPNEQMIKKITNSIENTDVDSVTSIISVYNRVFPRCERPNYNLTAGLNCIERMPQLSRTEFYIESNNNKLKAYYYNSKEAKGLILFSHGLNSGADDYLYVFNALVERGYDVLSYNGTGTYESDGESVIGMCQSLVDIDNVLSFIQSTAPYNKLPLFTMGHSWGGYAAASVLTLKKNINAAAIIAPVRDSTCMIIDKAAEYAGDFMDVAIKVVDAYQQMLFGDYVKYDVISGINSSNIPILIVQGYNDEVINYDNLSVMTQQNMITNKNVRFYLKKGLQGGHDSILHSERANIYRKQIEQKKPFSVKKSGSDLFDESIVNYYKNINHELYSEINIELIDEIINIFDKTIK